MDILNFFTDNIKNIYEPNQVRSYPDQSTVKVTIFSHLEDGTFSVIFYAFLAFL